MSFLKKRIDITLYHKLFSLHLQKMGAESIFYCIFAEFGIAPERDNRNQSVPDIINILPAVLNYFFKATQKTSRYNAVYRGYIRHIFRHSIRAILVCTEKNRKIAKRIATWRELSVLWMVGLAVLEPYNRHYTLHILFGTLLPIKIWKDYHGCKYCSESGVASVFQILQLLQ